MATLNTSTLGTVLWQEGVTPVRLCYSCAIPVTRFWELICGTARATAGEIDRICARLRITPDLRLDVFGEVEDDGR